MIRQMLRVKTGTEYKTFGMLDEAAAYARKMWAIKGVIDCILGVAAR